MNKITNKIALLACLLSCAFLSAFAASEAEFGKLSKAWTLHADGSQEFRCNKELTLFTHTAMNGTYGETFIVYNPAYQELKIHSSYTKQKDGTIVKTPDNAFVEVLPREAADAPAYNQLKEMVVVHTGLELGATIYLDYSILTKPGYYPELDINDRLQETSPVKAYTVSISVPENKPLAWDLYGVKSEVRETSRNGMKEVSWTLRNMPALSHEPYTPQNGNHTIRLVASTYPSPTDALATLAKRFNDSQAYECKTFARYITEEAKDEKEKIAILQKHVAENMGLSWVPLDETGYAVRDADVVLRSAYGTTAEKTQLLSTLLNAAGMQAEVVASYPALLKQEACGLKTMKELAVKTTCEGKEMYLSAVSLKEPSLIYRGELDRLYTLDGKEMPVQATPMKIQEEKELTVDASQPVGGYVVCTLPALSEGVDAWYMASLNSKRKEMMEIPSLIHESVTYTVTPAQGLHLKTAATSHTLAKPCGKVTQTIQPKGDKIEVVRTIELTQLQFTPGEYQDLRALLNEWNDPNRRVLLFSGQ